MRAPHPYLACRACDDAAWYMCSLLSWSPACEIPAAPQEAAALVTQWRQWCSSIKAAPVEERACCAPKRMYECRHLLQEPRPAQLSDEVALNAELSRWRHNARCFGALFKTPGQVVYHQKYAIMCQPPLLSSETPAVEKLMGCFCAAVGDRVMEKLDPFHFTVHPAPEDSRTPRRGVITYIDGDNFTEVGVRWDDGRVSDNLKCGKKDMFHLLYA